jgi:hypothetical protein
MYLGALKALESSGNPNPDALAQACHSLRELMEKLPTWYASVPAPGELPKTDEKARTLAGGWERMREKSTCLKDGNWGGEIDRYLQRWLRDAEKFFDWLRESRPEHHKRSTKLFRRLDPMGLPLPTVIEDERLQQWSKCRQCFVQISHHRTAAVPEEVRLQVSMMEDILLDLIRPTTFRKHEGIDAIIENGERNADS